MHPEAYEGFRAALASAGINPHEPLDILDIGGQYVNGSVHDLFTDSYTTITTLDLENADIIADATTWEPDHEYDLAIATEVFEHVENWPAVIRTMSTAAPRLVATCASTSRPSHGATGAPSPAPGEWYQNVGREALEAVLHCYYDAYDVQYRYPPGDAYMWAVRA